MVDGQHNEEMKKIFLINFFIFFFLIISLELISRIFSLSGLMGIQDGLMYNKNSINYFYPNKKGIIFDEDVFTDKFGFRVPEANFEYKGNKNIFILGDSVAFGNGIKESDTFIGLLRSERKNINFYNSSVPGYQLKDQKFIIQQIKNFKDIDNTLYFFTLNDIYGLSNVLSLKNKTKNESDFKLKEIKLFNRINTFLRNKSYLYMLVKGLSTDPSKRWFLNLLQKYQTDELDGLKENLRLMKNFTKVQQSKLVVLILPYEYQTRKCNKELLLPQYKLVKILNDLEIEYRDFTKNFCDQKKPKDYFYKFDPMHLSRNGHMLVYNTLKNEINF